MEAKRDTVTKKKPKPDKIKTHKPASCPVCGGTDLAEVKQTIRDITDIPPPPKPETTRHITIECTCKECGKTGITTEPDIPKRGSFGRNVTSAVIAAFNDRIPYRRIAKMLARFGISSSAATIYEMLKGVGISLEGFSASVLAMLRMAPILHCDETSLSLNGKNVWVGNNRSRNWNVLLCHSC